MTIGVTVGCMQVLLRAAGPLSGMRADLAGASVFPDTEVALPPQWLCDFGQISPPPPSLTLLVLKGDWWWRGAR